MKTKLELLKELKKQECSPAFIKWVESQPTSSAQIIWDNCQNGQWMLYLLGKRTAPNTQHHRDLVKAACLCAREVLHLVKKGDGRPLKAIETAEAWAEGRATLEEVKTAARAAYAANAAAWAAYAAAAAVAWAAYAAAAAVDAADAAERTGAKQKMLNKCADITRTVFPEVPLDCDPNDVMKSIL